MPPLPEMRIYTVSTKDAIHKFALATAIRKLKKANCTIAFVTRISYRYFNLFGSNTTEIQYYYDKSRTTWNRV